jgi:hypothetical protein
MLLIIIPSHAVAATMPFEGILVESKNIVKGIKYDCHVASGSSQ